MTSVINSATTRTRIRSQKISKEYRTTEKAWTKIIARVIFCDSVIVRISLALGNFIKSLAPCDVHPFNVIHFRTSFRFSTTVWLKRCIVYNMKRYVVKHLIVCHWTVTCFRVSFLFKQYTDIIWHVTSFSAVCMLKLTFRTARQWLHGITSIWQ